MNFFIMVIEIINNMFYNAWNHVYWDELLVAPSSQDIGLAIGDQDYKFWLR